MTDIRITLEEWLYSTARDGDKLTVRVFPGSRQLMVANLTRGINLLSSPLDFEDSKSVRPKLDPEVVSPPRSYAAEASSSTALAPSPVVQRFRCSSCGHRGVDPFCPVCDRMRAREPA